MTGWFEAALTASPVMGVFRNAPPQQAVEMAQRAWDAGVELVEIPIQSPDALPSLRAVVASGHDRGKAVGAGTILDASQVSEAAGAGAEFLVSPAFDIQIAAEARAVGIAYLPGVSTPTEIQHARAAGFTLLKAFPASALGAAWFGAVKGPFPDITLIATGGITHENADLFLTAGASVVGVGASFADQEGSARIRELIVRRAAGATA